MGGPFKFIAPQVRFLPDDPVPALGIAGQHRVLARIHPRIPQGDPVPHSKTPAVPYNRGVVEALSLPGAVAANHGFPERGPVQGQLHVVAVVEPGVVQQQLSPASDVERLADFRRRRAGRRCQKTAQDQQCPNVSHAFGPRHVSAKSTKAGSWSWTPSSHQFARSHGQRTPRNRSRRWKRRPPPLPDAFHAVSVEELFDRYEGQVEGQCLGDQHPVERVAMWTGQPPGALTVVGCNRQFPKPLAPNAADHVQGDDLGSRESSETMLRGDLPSGRRADEDVIRCIAYCGAGSLGQSLATGQPPQECMGVEEDTHSLTQDSQAASSDSGSGSKKRSSTTTRLFIEPNRRTPRSFS